MTTRRYGSVFDFDKDFARMRKFMIGWFVFVVVAGLATVAGLVWLVLTLLGHFAVI